MQMAKSNKKIPADRFLFALLSAYRTLAVLLSRRGVVDMDELVAALQQTAATHRESAPMFFRATLRASASFGLRASR
jgi:hypothetical protein